mmetsp:Transcript_5949/g.10566  ORF Transcript_5949/g.10566 Transcript_5949/m.10566 type:complete len:97 (-) Transcript_5949:1293-1583(-)
MWKEEELYVSISVEVLIFVYVLYCLSIPCIEFYLIIWVIHEFGPFGVAFWRNSKICLCALESVLIVKILTSCMMEQILNVHVNHVLIVHHLINITK